MAPPSWLAQRFPKVEAIAPGVWITRDRLHANACAVWKEAAQPLGISALRREAYEVGRGHRALRRVLAFAEDRARTVLVLEHVPGDDLATHLEAWPSDAAALARQLLSGLVHLHHHGFVHGDLKPANVVVERTTDGPRARLIDLALAARIGEPLRGGTGGFLAPELLRGAAASVAGDLFALGRTLATCIAHPEGELRALIDALVRPSPTDRPASADGALALVGAVPRATDRTGSAPRVGDGDALHRLRVAAADRRGHTVVVQGAAHSGRTRLLEDAVRDAIRAGFPIAQASCARGGDPIAQIAAILDVRATDVSRRAAMVGARAAELGLVIAIDDADAADAKLQDALVTAQIALAERQGGALLVVGADEALRTRLASHGASACSVSEIPLDDVARLLESVGAHANDAIARAIHRVSRGAAGRAVELALFVAESARPSVDAVAERARALDEREPPSTPSFASDDDALAQASALLEDGAASDARRVATSLLGSRRPVVRSRALTLLARASAARGDLDDAVRHVAMLGESASAALRVETGRHLERLGRYEDARAMVEDALSDSEHGADAAAVAAQAAFALGEVSAADDTVERALARATRPDVRARLYMIASDIALTRGDPERALALAHEARSNAEKTSDTLLLSNAIARAGAALSLSGAATEARAVYEEAHRVAERAGDLVGLVAHLLNLATAEHASGALAAAIEHYQRAARLAAGFGRATIRAGALVNWASLLVSVSALDEAARVLDDARAAAEASGSILYRGQVELIDAERVGKRDPVAALEIARRARTIFEGAEATRQALEARLLEAELSLEVGDRALLHSLLPERDALKSAGLGARFALAEARALIEEGRHDDALRRANGAAEGARAHGDRDLEARALAVAAELHGRLGTHGEEPARARAHEAMSAVAASLPAGLRQRYLEDPVRASILRLPPSADAGRLGVGASFERSSLGLHGRRLLALVGRLLTEGNERRILEEAVDEALLLSGAERAFLLRRRGRKKPHVAIARNVDEQEITRAGMRFSRSVAERVLDEGMAVVTAHAGEDPALLGAASILDLGLRSIACVPVRGPSGVIGALYLDHRAERERFDADTVELMQALADVMGLALENARMHRDAVERARDLERATLALRHDNELRRAEVDRLAHVIETRPGSAHARAGSVEIASGSGIVGRSPSLHRALDVARRVAKSDLSVLVTGESGTGKELVARYVHDESTRRDGPFLAINCGALPENLLESELFGHVRGAFTGATTDHPGFFRAASAGTLFLDEIGEMPPRMQTRLLRVLQEGEVRPVGGGAAISVDVRIVAATNRVLEDEITREGFRRDLYYRLAGVIVALPSLRERQDDVLPLADALLARGASRDGLPQKALSARAKATLLAHDWPGNVRELEQTLRRAALLAEGHEIDAEDLGLGALVVDSRRKAIRSFDRDLVERALRATEGNRTHAAKALGISRVTLHRWIRAYGLD